MRTFIVVALIALTMATEMDMAITSKLNNLKKTGWGQVASAFIELQLKLGGPMDDLGTAFKSLYMDLKFQWDMEQHEWALKTNDHNLLDASIRARIASAQQDIADATRSLENVLGPQKTQLETQLATDRALVAQTEKDMAAATAERGTDSGNYAQNVQDHTDAIAAVRECIALVQSLRNPAATLVEIQRTQNHIKKLEKHLAHKTEWGELVKVMVQLAQNFSDQGNVNRVLEMLNNVLDELLKSLENVHQDERDSQGAYDTFMELAQETLDQANQRIITNTEELDRTVQNIAETTAFRAKRTDDLAVAEADLVAETDRWNKETEIHNTLNGELQDQMQAIEEIVELVTAAGEQVRDSFKERLNQ